MNSFKRCRKAAARRVTRWSSTPSLGEKNGSRCYQDPKGNTQNLSEYFNRLEQMMSKIKSSSNLKQFSKLQCLGIRVFQGFTSWVVCTCKNNLLHILHQKYVTKILIRRKCNVLATKIKQATNFRNNCVDEQCPMNQINLYKLSYFHGNESISNK